MTFKMFTGQGRLLLYLTPAAATGLLPISAIDSARWSDAGLAIAAALGFLWVSVWVFRQGLRRYQTTHYLAATFLK